jgi:hypothetical protein
MTSSRDERTPLEGADKEFLDRLAEAYTPEPMTAGRRAAFDEAIRTRLARPRRGPLLIPALGAAAAAGLLWLVFSPSIGPAPQLAEEESAAVAASSWEDEIFLSSDLGASEDREEIGALPDDYLAIAGVFLDG